jgi:cell division protein FtsW (lipid II flippase)
MKLGMPMMAAWFLTRQTTAPQLKNVMISLVLIVIPFVLIAEATRFGHSLLVLASGIFVLFLSGLSWKMIGAALAAGVLFLHGNFLMTINVNVSNLLTQKLMRLVQAGTLFSPKPRLVLVVFR